MRQSDEVIDRYLEAARKSQGPAGARHPARAGQVHGRGAAPTPYLREPDVGLALDPEWSMRPGQLPGG